MLNPVIFHVFISFALTIHQLILTILTILTDLILTSASHPTIQPTLYQSCLAQRFDVESSFALVGFTTAADLILHSPPALALVICLDVILIPRTFSCTHPLSCKSAIDCNSKTMLFPICFIDCLNHTLTTIHHHNKQQQ